MAPVRTDTLIFRNRSRTPWVLGGAAIRAVVGWFLYQRALGPYGDDYVPYISIPYFVGGCGAIGAAVR